MAFVSDAHHSPSEDDTEIKGLSYGSLLDDSATYSAIGVYELKILVEYCFRDGMANVIRFLAGSMAIRNGSMVLGIIVAREGQYSDLLFSPLALILIPKS